MESVTPLRGNFTFSYAKEGEILIDIIYHVVRV